MQNLTLPILKNLYQSLGNKTILPYLICTVPILLFFITLYKYATNVPYMDDMELVDTINIVKHDSSKILEVLFRQQNDHRPTFSRIGILITYLVSGELNFRLAILIGYLNLLLLGWTFFLVHKTTQAMKWSFVPIPFLVFSPIVYQDHLWAITAFQYTLSIAFSLLSLYYLRPEKKDVWYLSFFYCLAACLTSIDGISLHLIALVWLSMQSRWKHTLYYLIFSGAHLLVYFYDYKLSSVSKIPISFQSTKTWIESFLALTGSIAKIVSDSYAINLSILLGAIIFLIFLISKAYLLFSKPRNSPLYNTNLLTYTDVCFIKLLLSMALIAFGRLSAGLGAMMAIRYQIYSVSILVLFYIFLLTILKGRTRNIFIKMILPLSILIFAFSYLKYGSSMRYYTSALKADTYNYPINGIFLHQYFNLQDPKKDFYEFYHFPTYFQKEAINTWEHKARTHALDTTYILSVKVIPNEGNLSHYLKPVLEFSVKTSDTIDPNNDYYLLLIPLEDKEKSYLVAMRRNGGWLSQIAPTQKPLALVGDIPDKIPKGTYAISLGWLNDGKILSKNISHTTSL